MKPLEKLTLVEYLETLRKLRTDQSLKGKSAALAKQVTELTKKDPKLRKFAQLVDELEIDDADGKVSKVILEVAKSLIKEMK
jgi:lipopolysaccharide biosynthesis regulator YciM